MPGLGQLLEGFSDGPDGSDSDDGSYTGGSDSDSGSGSSGASTQESNVSEFTGPTAEASASAMADSNGSAAEDDAKVAEAAADDAERIAAESSPEAKKPSPKKARAVAKAPADPGAGCSDAAIRAYLGRWQLQRSKLTPRLQRLLILLEEPDSGVEAAAKAGFDLPERSTDTGPKHALLVDDKVVLVFKKGAFGNFDYKACKEPSEAFTEQALATFGKKKRKAPAPAEGQAAKKPASAPAAGPATKIDSIFNKSGAAAKPVPEPEPEPAAAGAGIVPGPAPKPQTAEAATDPMPEPEPKPAPKPAPKPVVARAPSVSPDPQVPAVAGGTTEVPVSIYFTEGDPELVPRQGDDGSVVGFDAVRSTRMARAGSRAALLFFLPPLTPARPPHRRPAGAL